MRRKLTQFFNDQHKYTFRYSMERISFEVYGDTDNVKNKFRAKFRLFSKVFVIHEHMCAGEMARSERQTGKNIIQHKEKSMDINYLIKSLQNDRHFPL